MRDVGEYVQDLVSMSFKLHLVRPLISFRRPFLLEYGQCFLWSMIIMPLYHTSANSERIVIQDQMGINWQSWHYSWHLKVQQTISISYGTGRLDFRDGFLWNAITVASNAKSRTEDTTWDRDGKGRREYDRNILWSTEHVFDTNNVIWGIH